ncbi:MAG: sugar ABC transporter permease [Clostridiales bacterium]|jgi:multiple sugar transport system permease protein|nr:sugar ABC transporter permease [Clostridiales bacterium]
MRHKGINYAKYGYLFSLPFILSFLIFTLYPIIYTVMISFSDLKGAGMNEFKILEAPFDNFRLILNNNLFKTSLGNTVLIWVMNFIPQILLALILTWWFTSRVYSVRGQGAFKVLFYMPNIITAASIAMLYYSLFSYPIGAVNSLLQNLHLFSSPKDFLMDKWATRSIVAFIQFWMWYGYTMLILISGVLGINPELFEAADIDGASDWQTFIYVTLPNVRTIVLYTLVTSLIGGMQMFDIPRLFAMGGPDNATHTASIFIYTQAFEGPRFLNRAAAASMIMFIFIAILSAIIFYIMRDKEEEKIKQQRKLADKAATQKRGLSR